MNCARCGQSTDRFTITQRYCPPCSREVAALIAADAKRRTRRWAPKDLTGALA